MKMNILSMLNPVNRVIPRVILRSPICNACAAIIDCGVFLINAYSRRCWRCTERPFRFTGRFYTPLSACASSGEGAGTAISSSPNSGLTTPLAPCPIKPEYGFPWWLNHQHDMSDLVRLEARDGRPVDSDKFTYPSGGET